jgi:hypothetical protein
MQFTSDFVGGTCVKDVYEVLRQKELEVSRLKQEVEALRVAAPLLSDGEAEDRRVGRQSQKVLAVKPISP